jgi:hypothetical protein
MTNLFIEDLSAVLHRPPCRRNLDHWTAKLPPKRLGTMLEACLPGLIYIMSTPVTPPHGSVVIT